MTPRAGRQRAAVTGFIAVLVTLSLTPARAATDIESVARGVDATLIAPCCVRQQVSESALLYLDAASARRLSADDAGGDYYGARAGVEWQTSRNGTFALEQGRMRVRLYSGTHSQMSLRIKRGGPMLVYRLSF